MLTPKDKIRLTVKALRDAADFLESSNPKEPMDIESAVKDLVKNGVERELFGKQDKKRNAP